jgi:hypothetical protein
MEEDMKNRSRPLVFVTLFLFFWGGMSISSLSAQTDRAEEKSIYIGLMGGYSHSESQGRMADLRAELLLSVSRDLKLGIGYGYLSADRMHGSGFGGMMGGMDQSFKSTPLTLTAYLRKPLSDSADAVLLGGIGYYWSRYRDLTVQSKEAFGPHFGLGADLRIGRNILVIGEVSYRFVNFKGFRADLHPGFDFDVGGHRMNGFWYFNRRDGRYHFRVEDGPMDEFMRNLPPFDISLNGFSMKAGLRFGF